MSEEQLKAFIAKVQADASLQEQLKAEGADPVAIAKAAGFSITTDDLTTHRQNLSDKDLEFFWGGACPASTGISTVTGDPSVRDTVSCCGWTNNPGPSTSGGCHC